MVASKKFVEPFPNLVLPVSSFEVPIISQNSALIPDISDIVRLEDYLAPDSSVLIPETSNIAQHADSLAPGSSVLIPSIEVHIQNSSRVIKPTSFLRDFHYSMLSHKPLPHFDNSYPSSNYLSYDSISFSHKKFLITVSSQFEPQFYHQAVKFSQCRAAMKDELDVMQFNKTWTVVPLPKGKHSIGC